MLPFCAKWENRRESKNFPEPTPAEGEALIHVAAAALKSVVSRGNLTHFRSPCYCERLSWAQCSC